MQHSEEDCGAACLATIAKYYGRTFAINRIRQAVGTGHQGTNLLGLRRGAETLGFNARQGKVNSAFVDSLNTAPLPAIIHWKGRHWVVLYGQNGNQYVIADPSVGVRYLQRHELEDGWANGVILLLKPDEVRFNQISDDKVDGLGRFLQRVGQYRSLLGKAIFLNFMVGFLSLATPFLLQFLTDELLVQQDIELLTKMAIAVIVMIFISGLLELAQSNLIIYFSERLELDIILEFTRQILRLPLIYYESHRSGEIVSRLQDIQKISQLIFRVIISLPSQLFVAFISLILMLVYSIKLAILAISFSLFMAIPSGIYFKKLRQKNREILVNAAENQGILVELFKGAVSLKTGNVAPQAWEELQGRFGQLANRTLQTIQIVLFNHVFSKVMSGLSTIFILWFGGQLVIKQEMTIGQLLAFNNMNINFLIFISALVISINDLTFTQAAAERLNEIIDFTPENINDKKKPWANIPIDTNISCSRVNFFFPGRVDLLENFSITIPGGKITALIGPSGCGKSTLVKLISGLYLPQSGSIHFGNYNQNDLPIQCLREQVVLVPQNPAFWSRSILENFYWSYPYVSLEEIVSACEISGASDFINLLPDGYQTVLGEFGANISGGQKQRLAIAHAIVNNPPVLLLDESTGALDPISEAQLLDQLLSYRQWKTTILVSHRPEVISRADWVVVLEDGKLILEGTPQDLIHIPGFHKSFLVH